MTVQLRRGGFWGSLLLCAGLLTGAPASAQLMNTQSLTLAAAKEIAAAAAVEARANNWNVVIAVSDAGGHLLYLERMDGTQIGSVEVATEKARTSVSFRRATRVFQEAISGGGNPAMLGLRMTLPLEGGIPLMIDGQVVGAIGVSGVMANQDGIIAEAGVRAFEAMIGG